MGQKFRAYVFPPQSPTQLTPHGHTHDCSYINPLQKLRIPPSLLQKAMASSYLLLIAAVALLVSPALALNCTTQKFTQNAVFANCTDLPTLNAYLHWTYDPTAKPNPTLAVAFIAPPAKPDGWVAWALNPTAAGMVGSQALIAFKDANGSIVVKTYNISSYGPISESKISYEVLNKRAESSGGVMRIFATLALPAEDEVNQVWQAGSSVKDGVPEKHAFLSENLGSTGKLQLVSEAEDHSNGPAVAPAPASGASPSRQNGKDSGGSSRTTLNGFGLYGVLVLLGASVLLF